MKTARLRDCRHHDITITVDQDTGHHLNPAEWIIRFALGSAFEDPGDLREQIGSPARELAKFGHHDVLLVLSQLASSGMVPRSPGELGDEDAVRGRAPGR
jgi:hypothetical protein